MYQGKVAWAFYKMYTQNQEHHDLQLGVEILTQIARSPETCDKVEPYIILFDLIPNFGEKEEHIAMIDQLFILVNMNQRSVQEKLLINMIYAMSISNRREYTKAFNLLQLEYAKHPNYGQCLLYLYGKLVIRHEMYEFIYSAQSALQECLKTNSDEMYDNKCHFYLARSFDLQG